MTIRVGTFEVTQADDCALQPTPLDGRRIPDSLAGGIQPMNAREASARGNVIVNVSGPHMASPLVVPPSMPPPQPPLRPGQLPSALAPVQERMTAFFSHYRYDEGRIAEQRLVLDNTPAGVLRLGLVTPVQLTECFRTTRPLLNLAVIRYVDRFLAYKKEQGTPAERALYATMTREQFLDRLVGPNNKRWAVFLPEGDCYIDIHGERYTDLPGDEYSEDFLRDHLSWDEVFISSLISVSAKTPFLYNGCRNIRDADTKDGHYAADDGHVPMGVYTGSVGSYFSRPDCLDHRFMVVTPSHIAESGYGPKPVPDAPPRGLEDVAAPMFGVDHLASFAEARADTAGRFVKVVGRDEYLDTKIYKERLKLVVGPFLADAVARAAPGQKSYVRIDGLGLGVWSLQGRGSLRGGPNMEMSDIQAELMLEVYKELLAAEPALSANISTVDFRWIGGISPPRTAPGQPLPAPLDLGLAGRTQMIASRSSPADRLPPGHENELLVAQWAWDGNSMTGNEWWKGFGSNASSDPAAVACSLVGFTHNGQTNPLMEGPWMMEG